jgi:hypothetical protein
MKRQGPYLLSRDPSCERPPNALAGDEPHDKVRESGVENKGKSAEMGPFHLPRQEIRQCTCIHLSCRHQHHVSGEKKKHGPR